MPKTSVERPGHMSTWWISRMSSTNRSSRPGASRRGPWPSASPVGQQRIGRSVEAPMPNWSTTSESMVLNRLARNQDPAAGDSG
jgi:hypothetical protein